MARRRLACKSQGYPPIPATASRLFAGDTIPDRDVGLECAERSVTCRLGQSRKEGEGKQLRGKVLKQSRPVSGSHLARRRLPTLLAPWSND